MWFHVRRVLHVEPMLLRLLRLVIAFVRARVCLRACACVRVVVVMVMVTVMVNVSVIVHV
jgi:hypothetical protein